MNDTQFAEIIYATLEDSMINGGFQVDVAQLSQPTQQGVNWTPQLFYQVISDIPYGWSSPTLVFDDNLDLFKNKEVQIYIATVRVSALSIEDPKQPSLPTAKDLVNYAKMYITHRAIQSQLKAKGVSPLRASQVMNNNIVDDREQFEFNPYFEIQFVYNRSIELTTPVIKDAEGSITGI